MKIFSLMLISGFIGFIIAGIAPQTGEDTTICHSSTQTHCLWVDGTATWKE